MSKDQKPALSNEDGDKAFGTGPISMAMNAAANEEATVKPAQQHTGEQYSKTYGAYPRLTAPVQK